MGQKYIRNSRVKQPLQLRKHLHDVNAVSLFYVYVIVSYFVTDYHQNLLSKLKEANKAVPYIENATTSDDTICYDSISYKS